MASKAIVDFVAALIHDLSDQKDYRDCRNSQSQSPQGLHLISLFDIHTGELREYPEKLSLAWETTVDRAPMASAVIVFIKGSTFKRPGRIHLNGLVACLL